MGMCEAEDVEGIGAGYQSTGIGDLHHFQAFHNLTESGINEGKTWPVLAIATPTFRSMLHFPSPLCLGCCVRWRPQCQGAVRTRPLPRTRLHLTPTRGPIAQGTRRTISSSQD